MTAAAKIAEARALIEPLTDTTPGPWVFSDRTTPGHFWIEPEVGYLPDPHYLSVSGPISRKNATLIAASPTLRDTVAALADGWEAEIANSDALAQEIAKLRSALHDTEDRIERASDLCHNAQDWFEVDDVEFEGASIFDWIMSPARAALTSDAERTP